MWIIKLKFYDNGETYVDFFQQSHKYNDKPFDDVSYHQFDAKCFSSKKKAKKAAKKIKRKGLLMPVHKKTPVKYFYDKVIVKKIK